MNNRPILMVGCAAAVIALTATAGLARQERGARPAAGQATATIAVGVVCEDSLLMPVAVRDARGWRSLTTDPKANPGAPVKLTAEGAALRAGWTIVPFDATATSRAITLQGAPLIDDASLCTDQEGFRTDAPHSRPRRPTDFIGIGLIGRVTLEPLETVQHLPDASSRRVGTLITQLVQTLEADRIDQAPAGASSGQRLPSTAERSRVEVELWNMWRHRNGGNDWYYFEAQKDYESNSIGNTFVKGWIAAPASGLSAVLMRIQVAVGVAADGVSVGQGNALAVLRLGDRAVWIMDERGYETHNFELVEIAPDLKQPVCILHGC